MAWIHCSKDITSLDVTCKFSWRFNHVPEAVVTDGRIYVFGYRCETESKGMEVVIFDTKDYSFRSVQPPPRVGDRCSWTPDHCSNFFAAARGHLVYICCKDDNYFGTEMLHCFNTRTLRWSCVQTSGHVPERVSWVFTCVVKDKLVVSHKYRLSKRPVGESRVFILDLDTMEWKRICWSGFLNQYIPCGAMAIGTKAYVSMVDSSDPTKNRDILAVLDTDTGKWEIQFPRAAGRDEFEKPLPLFSWIYFVDSEYVYAKPKTSSEPQECCIDDIFRNLRYNECFLRYSKESNEWGKVKFQGRLPRIYIDAACAIGTKAYLFYFDLREMHVLDFAPTLYTLCLKAVCENHLDCSSLPNVLKRDVLKLMLQ